MRKKGYKGRCEKRILEKCKAVCRTYDVIQSAYADILQNDGNRQIMMRSDIKLPQPFASWSNSL